MNCCGGFGVRRVRYHSGEPDAFGVCLCPAGQAMRDDTNAGRHTGYALWQVWAYRNQINPEQIWMLEELLDDAELAELFPDLPRPGQPPVNDIAAVIAAGRTGKGPRL